MCQVHELLDRENGTVTEMMSGGAASSLTLDCLRFFVLEQKEQLKVIIGAKDREEGARGSETVKVQLRSTLVSDSTLSIPDF